MPQESIVCLPDISEQVSKDGKVTIDFLLPNGMFIQLSVDFQKPLDLLKQTIWESAKKYPLYNQLKERDRYMFEYLNRNGDKEEVSDESLRLSEIRPIGKFLRLLERRHDQNAGTLQRQITNLLENKTVMEMSAANKPEVDDFRKKMEIFAQSKVPDRSQMFERKYPLQLRTGGSEMPKHIREKLRNGDFVLSVRIKENRTKFLLQSHVEDTVELVVDKAMSKWHNQSVRHTSDYILKVVGTEDYLYGRKPLHCFKYVYNCIQRNIAPDFWLVNKHDVLATDYNRAEKPLPPVPTRIGTVYKRDVLVWDIDDNFELKIGSIQNIEYTSDKTNENIDKVRLCVGLYHGSEVLGDVKTTADMPVAGGNCSIDSSLVFDIQVKDIHIASRLCFTLYGFMKGSKSPNPIAWVNIPVFDFRSRLMIGEQTLAMWPVLAELQLEETGCYPLGTVSSNPHCTISLKVVFSEYKRNPPIVFPSDEMITACAADNMEAHGMPGSPDWHPPKECIRQLRDTLSRQLLSSDCLHEQDKENVWLMRYECREDYPHALSLVLKCVKWHNHVDVAKMQVLLATWKQKVPVDNALELLDFNFPDRNVRKYAIECLQDLSDDKLSLYLLQLVQALKYETYLYCPLAEFLIERALRNQHIGHQFFWLLKSELYNPMVTIRFGLLLEAYLKASPDHMSILYQQFEALNKLNSASMLVKSESTTKTDKAKQEAYERMRTVLKQKTYQNKLSNFCSPLSPLFRLHELQADKCKYMHSKKRPLYLVWTNEDEEGKEVHIIYKNGDDLRQDMLTLQIFQLMDSIWSNEGLDLRMNAYGCIATGRDQGMIEVVRHSKTLANIQMAYNATMDKRTLFDWLKEQNKDDEKLDQAIEEFILSCAGYTVATYVLGIGDRHNDNIMLKETGQLFHIDFGHFLGNFKKFGGVKRERVPFILTTHFIYVITKGDTVKSNYERFEKYCVQAYLILRKNGPLLIRLFMMMLNSGMPELTSVSSLDYLKDTLALNLTEDEADRQLRKKLKEVVKSKTTVINWFVHNKVHGK